MRRLAVGILAAALAATSLIPFLPANPKRVVSGYDGDCWAQNLACKVCGQIPDGIQDHSACITLYNSCKETKVGIAAVVPRVDFWMAEPDEAPAEPAFEPAMILTPVVQVVPVSEAPFKIPIA